MLKQDAAKKGLSNNLILNGFRKGKHSRPAHLQNLMESCRVTQRCTPGCAWLLVVKAISASDRYATKP